MFTLMIPGTSVYEACLCMYNYTYVFNKEMNFNYKYRIIDYKENRFVTILKFLFILFVFFLGIMHQLHLSV